MRIGIFGGTFDPVHLGHLIVAEQAREQANLDEVWFVPSARPPHKNERTITAFDRRAAMLELALAGQPKFRIELIEKDRPGPSFTVDTLEDLRRTRPQDEWFLILGGDSLADFPGWRAPERILELAKLLVVGRPGWPMEIPSGMPATRIESPLIDISSRDLRQRAAEGRSLLYLVPRAVEVLIREKQLYREGT